MSACRPLFVEVPTESGVLRERSCSGGGVLDMSSLAPMFLMLYSPTPRPARQVRAAESAGAP